MAPQDLILHLANFVAPAMVVAILLALVGPLFMKKPPLALVFIAQVAINFIACAITLGLGLWFFGRDGKMAAYAAMLVVAATSQWAGGRGWR